jgi:hypothetical protein
MVFTGKCMIGFDLPATYHSDPEFLLKKPHPRPLSSESSGSHIHQVVGRNQHSFLEILTILNMNFKQLVYETIVEVWERFHDSISKTPSPGMEEWHITQGFYYGLTQAAKEHICALAGGIFFSLKAKEAQALFERIAFGERRDEEPNQDKINFHTAMVDPLMKKF